MRLSRPLTIALAAGSVLLACRFELTRAAAASVEPAAVGEARAGGGTHRYHLRHDGLDRAYLLHVPAAARRGGPLPLVLSFHGAMGSGEIQERFTQMDSAADRHGFLVAYLDGTPIGLLAGRSEPQMGLLWNAGTCCGRAALDQVDDVGFALSVIDDVARRARLDRSRVYATGMSNGGMMAHRLAVEAADRIAAIAPVAGGLVFQPLSPSRPVPLLHIHSVDDPRALYHGGLGPGLAGAEVLHPDIDAMMDEWARADGCTGGPSEVDHRTAENGDTATLLRWDGCAGGVEVALWRLTGAGHTWPGHPSNRALLLGQDTVVIDANEEIWKFVSRFRR
jgi:polyhydroxybutyrate depolymerase